MGINYKKLNDYEPGGGSGASEWFRPKPGGGANNDGRFSIRLVLKPGEDMPFFDTKIHYFRSKDGFASGACPAVNGETCPACEMFFKLRLLPEFDEATNKALLRKVAPTTRVYANIIERGTDRVQVWSMPYSVASDLRSNLLTYLEDGMDLTDPDEGRDFVISVIRSGSSQKYESVTVRPRSTPIGVEDWEAQCHDLEAKAHGRIFTADDVEAEISKVLGDKADEFLALMPGEPETPAPVTEEVAEAIGEAV